MALLTVQVLALMPGSASAPPDMADLLLKLFGRPIDWNLAIPFQSLTAFEQTVSSAQAHCPAMDSPSGLRVND
jgi:hypothetical protein